MYISYIKAHGFRGRLLDPSDVVEVTDDNGTYLVSMNVAIEVKNPDKDKIITWDEKAKPKKAEPTVLAPGTGR